MTASKTKRARQVEYSFTKLDLLFTIADFFHKHTATIKNLIHYPTGKVPSSPMVYVTNIC